MANHNVTFLEDLEIYKRIGAIKIIIEKIFERRRMMKSNYSIVVMLPSKIIKICDTLIARVATT
jgi:hypothetical protein